MPDARHDSRTALQRSASLMQLPGLLAQFGVELDAVLANTGVTPEQLRPDGFIPYAAFLRILDNACRETARGDVGMLLGQRQTLAALGPLGAAMRHAAARELLILGALDIADIALTLDYASVSSFVHAFRRWSGMSPGRWRAERGG